MAEASSKSEQLRVFISYSRDDLAFADQLDATLKLIGFDTSMDRHGVHGGENWKARLSALIRDADTVVFVLSPNSAASPICAWEVEEAERLGKRIMPVVPSALDGAPAPLGLAALNYIFFYSEQKKPGSSFGAGLTDLVQGLKTDLSWLREHTRLLQRATEWTTADRPSNRLLSGSDITAAKDWVARRPKDAPAPTELHLDFINASDVREAEQQSERQKQLEERERLVREAEAAQLREAKAQKEQEKALADREQALADAAIAQRQTARAQKIIVRGSITAAVILASVAAITGFQWKLANDRKEHATEILGRAITFIWRIVDLNKADAEDLNYAVPVFERGAAFGNLNAMRGLGWLYDEGKGVVRDPVKAREWWQKAAAEGDAKAMRNMGVLFEKANGVELDYAKAREWYERAAAKGEGGAMRNMGLLYLNARGVPHDYAQAHKWFEAAVAAGETAAMRNIGNLYANGSGVPQDFAKAREWYEKAIAAGDISAMNSIGVLYEKGTSPDYSTARQWYEKAAAAGVSAAMHNMGRLHQTGLGVQQNDVLASEWYEKAAMAGHDVAMFTTATRYANGWGVTQDDARAREWYRKAADAGHAEAADLIAQRAIDDAEAAGQYADALNLQHVRAIEIEARETARDGQPGWETSEGLTRVALYALLAHAPEQALIASERALTLQPDDFYAKVRRAHALMFLDRPADARATYQAIKDRLKLDEDIFGPEIIAADFVAFRKAGLVHPMMVEIEALLATRKD